MICFEVVMLFGMHYACFSYTKEHIRYKVKLTKGTTISVFTPSWLDQKQQKKEGMFLYFEMMYKRHQQISFRCGIKTYQVLKGVNEFNFSV